MPVHSVPRGEVAKVASSAMYQVLLCFGARMEMEATENLTSAVNAEGLEDDICNCSQNPLEC